MIQGGRAAGLTHMGQCSSRRTVSAEKMTLVTRVIFISGPGGREATGRQPAAVPITYCVNTRSDKPILCFEV